jgi:hypothetical protein
LALWRTTGAPEVAAPITAKGRGIIVAPSLNVECKQQVPISVHQWST